MPTTETLVQSPTIGAIENADLLWVWDVTASALNKVTRENLVGGTIAGGGTINLNGQTFTVSSGGTIALNGATFTVSSGGTIALNGATFAVPSSGGTAVVSAGVSGGQTLIGGTAANDDLTLEGTSNATRTTSYVVLQPNGGNVGIGTTSPVGKLHIGATTNVVSPGSIALSIRDASTPTFGFDFNLEGVLTGDLSLMRTVNGTQSQVMTFQRSSGNVGIGTTSPGEKLQVAGALTVTGTTATALANASSFDFLDGFSRILAWGSNATTRGKFQILLLESDAENPIIALNIDSNGNVGIGTTSPDTRLDIDAGAIEFAEMTAPAAGAANTGRLFCRDNGSGKTQLCVIFNTGAIQVIATQP